MAGKNIIFVYGEDSYSVFETGRQIIADFIAKNGDHNFEKFYGDEIDSFRKLRDSLETLPFIGDRRMVFLRDPWNTRKSTWRGDLAAFIDHVPETTIFLVAETTKPDKRETLFKRLDKSADVRKFPLPSPVDLAKKIKTDIENLGGRIGLATAQKIIERSGQDGFRLRHEIQKLVLVAGSAEITADLINRVSSPADPLANIFALTDALGARNLRLSLLELHRLLEDGENELRLLATLVSHFRTLLLVSDLMSRHPKAAPNLSAELKIHPYAAKKALGQIRNFSFAELKQIYRDLADLDFLLKTAFDSNPWSELERLCIRICSQ